MNISKTPNFLDKSTLFALGLIFISWFMWERHVRTKYPAPETPPAQQQASLIPATQEVKNTKEEHKRQSKPYHKEKTLTFEDDKWNLVISSRGLGVKKILLKNFYDRDKEQVLFESLADKSFFGMRVNNNEDLNFRFKKVSQNKIEARARVNKTRIKVDITIKDYFLVYDLSIKGPALSNLSLQTSSIPIKGASGFIQGLLSGADRALSLFTIDSKQEEERIYYVSESPESLKVSNLEAMGLGAQYFGQAFFNNADLFPSFNFKGDDTLWQGNINYEFPRVGKVSSLKYKIFFGPKSIEALNSVNPSLSSWINYGFFRPLCKFILIFLQLAFDFTSNWGLSIIILTFFVRLLLFPLNLVAYRSMKVMRVIQPQMKEIRERLKKDSKKMNAEILSLMKREKASPFGGILPIFVQFPIFFALYRVLSESFELYQSPFAFWIQDLSTKDPYFILPILMGGAMYLQQKITPTNMEPAQEKIMRFLPIIFTLFMINLPSGLTLYIFISTLFGLTQQYYFTKTIEKPKTQKVEKLIKK